MYYSFLVDLQWTALTKEAGNEAFNTVDDSPFSHGAF